MTCLLIPFMVFFKENRFLILNVVQCIDHFLYVKHSLGLKKCWPIQGSNDLLWKTLILQKTQSLIFLISDSSSKTSQACRFSFKHKLGRLPYCHHLAFNVSNSNQIWGGNSNWMQWSRKKFTSSKKAEMAKQKTINQRKSRKNYCRRIHPDNTVH